MMTPKIRTAIRNVSHSSGPSRLLEAENADPTSGVMRP